MNTIFVKNIINEAFSINDAKIINSTIDNIMINNCLLLDFSNINYFTTHFFQEFISNNLLNLLNDKIRLINLNEIGNSTFNFCFNFIINNK